MSLYIFRALNAHLQEDTLYTCSIWYCTVCNDRPPRTLVESDSTICGMYTVYPPADEHLRLEKYRGT